MINSYPNAKGYLILGKCDRNRRMILEHVVIAERALGKPLPKGAVVHHWDKNRQNNNPLNLLICPNESYHQSIHRRMRAKEICGHAGWILCSYCGTYDNPENLYMRTKGKGHHKTCKSKWDKKHYQKNKDRILANQRKRYWEKKK